MADSAAALIDLEAEHLALAELVDSLTDRDWELPTPAPGWRVRHQIAHLAYFSDAAVTALRDPEAFSSLRARSDVDSVRYSESVLEPYADMPGSELACVWLDAVGRLVAALRAADLAQRVPWYGPSMSQTSMITARLMEAWAHGQDVRDALGLKPLESGRLAHVARLACMARSYSYTNRRFEVPEVPVRVILTRPAAEPWEWTETISLETIKGPLLDFCLVLTRRRHWSSSRMVAHGQAAREWLTIGQAYAGPPGLGRRPDEFAPWW